jgi:hypothetical protein
MSREKIIRRSGIGKGFLPQHLQPWRWVSTKPGDMILPSTLMTSIPGGRSWSGESDFEMALMRSPSISIDPFVTISSPSNASL